MITRGDNYSGDSLFHLILIYQLINQASIHITPFRTRGSSKAQFIFFIMYICDLYYIQIFELHLPQFERNKILMLNDETSLKTCKNDSFQLSLAKS